MVTDRFLVDASQFKMASVTAMAIERTNVGFAGERVLLLARIAMELVSPTPTMMGSAMRKTLSSWKESIIPKN
jgi:hypothetical protein